jgi:hypothetical protein
MLQIALSVKTGLERITAFVNKQAYEINVSSFNFIFFQRWRATTPRQRCIMALWGQWPQALTAGVAFSIVDRKSKTRSQVRQRAAAAQQLYTLIVVSATRRQPRREIIPAHRGREHQLRRGLHLMRAGAAAVQDGGSGSGAEHTADDLMENHLELRGKWGNAFETKCKYIWMRWG